MRLAELVLERYGAFEQRLLTLNGPGLTVVYGPNAAGKSTCLAAVSDFFFSIPKVTSRTSIFGSDLIRIGATLITADGREIRLKRRYGRGRTLIDETGAPCDDGVLGQLLGATTRDRFEHLFGLGHQSLREGGDRLLRADGEIGRLIVEAGGGLRTLMSRLDAIAKEIDALFAPRPKESRAFYKARDAFNAANKTVKAATLTRDAYERDHKVHEAATAAVVGAREKKRKLTESLSSLQRTERTIPTLRELDCVEAELTAYSDVSLLSDDFANRCELAFAGRDKAADELAKMRLRHEELSKKLDAMVIDAGLAVAEVAVHDIEQKVTLVTAARNDRTNRVTELNTGVAQLAALRQRQHLGPEVDLECLMPSPEALEAVRVLANEALERRSRLENARDAAAADAETVRKTETRVAALAGQGWHEPFGMAAASFGTLPTDWAAAQGKLEQAKATSEVQRSRAAALGFAGLDALRALACPNAEQVRQEIEARNEVSSELTRQVSVRASKEAQRDAARVEIDRLRQGSEIATDEALAAARKLRDEAWRPIRAAHLLGSTSLSDAERMAEVAALEASVINADRLSDNRTSEAQRIASLVEAERRLSEAEAAIKAAEGAERRLDQALGQRADAFRLAFPEAFDIGPEPPALLALVEARADILTKADTAQATLHEGEQALQKLTPRLRQLELAERKANLQLSVAQDLVERVEAIAKAITAHDQAYAGHQRDERDLINQQSTLGGARRKLANLERDQQAWAAKWAQAAAALGLQADASPEIGAELVSLWTGARGELRSVAQTRRRLSSMDEDEAELETRVSAAAQPLGIALPDDRVVAGNMLVGRWRENNEVRLRRETLAPELEGAAAIITAQERTLTESEKGLRTLALEAGLAVGGEAGLNAVARRQREWAALWSKQGQLVWALRRAGDGLELSLLREQAEGLGLDAVRAGIADLKERLDILDQEIDTAIRKEQLTKGVLDAHEDPSAAARAVVDRESATAEMHAAVKRYVELRLARELVGKAIQRVRAEQQDPLIRKAGAMFARITRGEYKGVATDVDSDGAPVVVGVKPGARPEGVATMSDGARDQLFLAFRLASLANYCAAAEPIPFIADDILVHFDDSRSAATLDLLADFCTTTQVLLFTHHLSVRSAAEALASRGRATIVEIER